MGREAITRRALLLMAGAAGAATAKTKADRQIPVLVYHRLGPVGADSMTLRTPDFESQIRTLHNDAFRVAPLAEVIDELRNPDPVPAAKLAAITADDGHRSVYSTMWPILERGHVPITLFIYPSAISNAGYALTWEQLREMRKSPLVSIGSHTFWHPNFHHEKKRLSPEAYRRFVQLQLARSKDVLEQQLSTHITWLAWPFGIYDDELIRAAEDAGYTAGFTIERRPATPSDPPMALPRLLMTDQDTGARFERLIGCG